MRSERTGTLSRLAVQVRRVFLSHTSELRDYPRKRSFIAAAEVAIARSGNAISNMAYWTARDSSPAAHCRQMVGQADVYVGIIGSRYGTPVQDQPDVSYTELEFDTATGLSMPRLIFLVSERVRTPRPAGRDASPEEAAKQEAFRRRLRDANLLVGTVATPDELEMRLYQALVELASSSAAPAAARRPAPARSRPPRDASGPGSPPRYRTRFVVREEDSARLTGLLSRAGSLVTVHGAPGCGKTRLVAEVTARLAAAGRPVRWVQVLPDAGDRLAQALAPSRRQAGGILVLDDADLDLAAAAPAAGAAARRGTTVVVTSRRPLGVYGEQLVHLWCLPVPDRHLRPTPGDASAADMRGLLNQESVALFVDRATLANPNFQLDRANAAAVFDVCRWLDGIPLAIELAALRLRQMTVTELAHNVDDLLSWLSGNTADVPGRHASMAASIGWSFDQLDQRQRTVAARLSVFEATFSADDAAAVAVDGEHPRDVVVDTMLELVDRSLLVWRENADGRPVYRWLRPIKQYGRRLLDRAEDRERTLERYRSWVGQIVDSLDASPPRRESEWERLAELTPELVSAVYDLPAAEQAAAIARMTDALSTTLQFGHLAGHVSWFSHRLSGGPQMLRQAGMLARLRGDFVDARANFELAYRIAVTNRDVLGTAHAALDLAENAADLSEYADAEQQVERADTLYGRLDDDGGRIGVLNLRGKLHYQRDHMEAAEPLFHEALSLATQAEDTRLVAQTLQHLGICDSLLRRISTARGRLAESLQLRERMRNNGGMVTVIEAFALVESQLGNHALVLELLGAARQYRRSSGLLGIPRWWQERLEDAEAEARVRLVATPGAADQRLQQGAAMTLADAGQLATAIPAGLGREPLGDPVSESLRRSMPADALPDAGRDQAPSRLELASREFVASGGKDPDAYRALYGARVLALAEPIAGGATDLLCFAIDPRRYRGLIVPAFVSADALAEALRRRPEWASRPVVEIRMQRLSADLGVGETAVVNPWTPYEFRIVPAEHGYGPSFEVPDPQDRSPRAPSPS